MSGRGRKPVTYTCPTCLVLGGPTRDGHGPYYDCDECGVRLVMVNGQLRETRGYQRQIGVIEKVEREFYRMNADEYEELVG